jgi:hypothetical protein
MATSDQSVDVRALTEVVGRLRRTLRRSIRTDYPWEQLPMARVELMHALSELGGSARVGELVQRLIDDGLAERMVDPLDRRASVIALMPAGAEELERWTDANDTRIRAAMGSLPSTDQTAIRQALPALQSLVDALEQHDGSDRT